jgi:cysteine synthase A
MIYDNILQLVGRTPVVRLNRIGADLPVELYGKCDFLNPGGSLKDRVAVRMVEKLEEAGGLKPGDTIVEPTSGNTGIGLAMTAAVKGYRLIVTMCDKISMEKEWILRSLGAEVLRTVEGEPHTSPRSQYGRARALCEEHPDYVMPNQYSNPENCAAHYHGTGAEIYEEFGDSLAAVVVGVGTGGTIMGVSRWFKERSPDTLIVGVEPEGSMLGTCTEAKPFLTEGIGYDWVPEIFDFGAVDRFLAVHDREIFRMARRLIREEGLLVGGSSGAVACAMLAVAAELPAGSKVLGILPDGTRNYLGKFPSDDWMREHGWLED